MILHNVTVTVFAAVTDIVPINPASNVAGQPGATVSPVTAPVTVIVEVEQVDWEIDPKSIDVELAMKVGTVAVSTL